MVDAFLNVVLDNLNSLIQKELGLVLGVNKEMEKLSSTLSTIRAVLGDAEEKQLNDRAIKNWLRKLNDASYELDDILEDCGMETSQLEFESQNSRWKQKVCSSFLFHFNPMNTLLRRKIAKKMTKIGERLDEIANERSKFHLQELVGDQRQIHGERQQTGSILTQPKVYGREEDKEKIVKFLVSDASNCNDVSVYPIVGMGGIGKTTLAQLIFSDERVTENFELKLWVCVTQDFDVKRLIKAIIESSSGSTCEVLDMDPLQRRLQDIMRGKKFLLVLDDIWNEDQEQWDRLKYVLACGSNGASIIVTTRLKKVASIMGTIQMHLLSGLSEDDCWLLFKQRAFGNEKEEQPNFVKLGKEIVRRCGGVPLAAKALGGLMRFKSEENEWTSVLQSELWNLPEDEDSLLPALRLSYFNLPLEQRRCFAFCALFPKDSRIGKERIIRLWMANGFISSKGQMEVEEIGDQIFNELYWRSLFEDYKKDYFGNWSFKMHDLVHDLAQSVMEDECHFMKLLRNRSIYSPRARYLTCSFSNQPFNNIAPSQSLRTLMLLTMDNHTSNFNCYLNFPSLRAFDAEYFTVTSISSLIKWSKHLRYINLSYSDIKTLPESICYLQNLQTLDLTGCSYLQNLPKHISRLRSLRHLNIFGCVQFSEFARNIGRLSCLRTLSIFIVGSKRGCHLEELQGLNLGGDLEIKGLEKVRRPEDAKMANLTGKRNISKLSLCWGTKQSELQENVVEQVLEALEPSPTLTILEIKNYKGVCFPHWLSNGILENVGSITLSDCKNCSQLPALNKLPSLRYLYIHQMNLVQYVDNGSYDGETLGGFLRLENLMIRNLPNLEKLSRNQENKEIFPHLSELYLSHCYKLTMLPCISSLKKLQVWKSNKAILNSISNFPGLISLDMHKIDGLTSLPDQMLQNLTTLQMLRITYFPNLRDLPNDMLNGLNAMEKLHIGYCDELECLPDGIFQSPRHIKCITIENCKKFKSLSKSFRNLTALQSLDLSGCPELEAFPSGLDQLSSLRHLTMSGLYCYDDSQCSASKMEVLPEALQHLPSLESMIISDFPNLTTLPDWLGNLTSLQELLIGNCPNLRSIPTSIQHLSNLRKLSIQLCPKLHERCKQETGEDWVKIAHIPNVYLC